MVEEPFYNILIVEDDENEFLGIRKTLLDGLGHLANIYPNQLGRSGSPVSQDELIARIASKDPENFKKILDELPLISIFIIDNRLLDGPVPDESGGLFNRYLIHTTYNSGDYRAIIATGTHRDEFPEGAHRSEKDVYLIKDDKFTKADILRNVIRLLDLSKRLKNMETGRKRLFSPQEKVYFRLKDWSVLWEYVIDVAISSCFYAMILLTVGFAIYHIVAEFVISNQDFLTGVKKHDESIGLKNAEAIYTYIIPIFIVFGFFNYYSGYTRVSLLSNRIGRLNEYASTKAMRLTKILFISSIISYLCIRVIEELFDRPRLIALIGSGLLIVILILYFIFLENNSHKKHAE